VDFDDRSSLDENFDHHSNINSIEHEEEEHFMDDSGSERSEK
jgi:hypothetical protein